MSLQHASGLIDNAAVGASLEQIALIAVNGRERLNIEFVVGGANLNAFEVGYQPSDSTSSDFFVVANATANFTTPAANAAVRGASGDLTGAAAGATIHWLVLDTKGIATVRLRASTGTSGTVSGSWGAS